MALATRDFSAENGRRCIDDTRRVGEIANEILGRLSGISSYEHPVATTRILKMNSFC